MMRPLFFCLCLIGALYAKAQDTFSIVAIDSVSGEIGSAGASCLGFSSFAPHGAQIISDVIPGKGVIHTQAQYDSYNQQTAHDQMTGGSSPQQIIDYVTQNDVISSPDIRQYGVVDYNNGHPRSAGYTGVNCMDYKNHIAGAGFCVQGNILLGQQILNNLAYGYLNSTGSLSDRLMAALEKAKAVGADTRCGVHNTSSLSAFIRVARPGDSATALHLDLWMSYDNNVSGTLKRDPIDSLQTLYTRWKLGIADVAENKPQILLMNNGSTHPYFEIKGLGREKNLILSIYTITGQRIIVQKIAGTSGFLALKKGLYIYEIAGSEGYHSAGKVAVF